VDFLGPHFIVVLVTSESLLDNLHVGNLSSFPIGFNEEVSGNLLDVNLKRISIVRLSVIVVKGISYVLHSDLDFVGLNGYQGYLKHILKRVLVELLLKMRRKFMLVHHIVFVALILVSHLLFFKLEEILRRLILLHLDGPLQRRLLLIVEQLQVVSGRH